MVSVKYGLLGMLAKEPLHGYELKTAFEERAGGFWNINYGQIYSTLDRLTRAGLVEAETESTDAGRERKVYSITKKGAADLRRWLMRPVERRRPLRDELFVKLALLDPNVPEPILRLLEDQRQFYLARMAELTREKLRLQTEPGGGDRLMTDLLIDAALFHAEADLRWLDHCESRLTAFVAGQRQDGGQETTPSTSVRRAAERAMPDYGSPRHSNSIPAPADREVTTDE